MIDRSKYPVWLTIPSARPAAEVDAIMAKWHERSYAVALWRDRDGEPLAPGTADIVITGEQYPGYGASVNLLMRIVRERCPYMRWCVTGGDDIDPDPNHTAETIAESCEHYFGNLWTDRLAAPPLKWAPISRREGETFGVMQPTGDRFAQGSIDRIAGSAWIGRTFQERAYGGQGPLWEEYLHCWDDQELQEVAIMLGVFWQRPDLIHLHHHYTRQSDAIDSPSVPKPIPSHLKRATSATHWQWSKAIFDKRRAAKFPGHDVS